jgi:GntR family transcriptional repressor for pyruvate dehydrogenase complex
MTSERSSAEEPGTSGNWALPADSRRPLPQLIEDKLRELIERGEFAAGDRLPTEPELAARLEVARSSLRTALQRLQLHGIVEVVRGRGWYVRSTDIAGAEEPFPARLTDRRFRDADLLEVRIALEQTAASLAAARATTGEIDEIAKLSTEHETASSADKAALLHSDETFHGAIVAASHNEFLEELYQTLVPHLREYRRNTYASREVHRQSALEHNQVVIFLRRRDEVAARTAMTAHLLGQYNRLVADDPASNDPHATLGTFVAAHDDPIWHRRAD